MTCGASPDTALVTCAESIRSQFKKVGRMVHEGALEVRVTDTASNTRSRVTIQTQAPTRQGMANNMNMLAAQFGGSLGGLGLALPSSQAPRLGLPAPRQG